MIEIIRAAKHFFPFLGVTLFKMWQDLWYSSTVNKQKKLRHVVGYSESEIPAVFISIGNAPEKLMVTGSQRVEKEAIYKIV